MIGITNAISSIIGRIVVSYPVGSTCTCTNGSVTYTAKDTSGACVFNVMSLGTWTVSCSTGGSEPSTASADVVIDEWWQTKNVTLSYEVILISNGVIQDGVNFTVSQYGALTSGSQSQAYALFTTSGNYAVIAYTTDKIDITSFSTLNLELDSTEYNWSYCSLDNCPVIGISSDVPTIGSSSAELGPADAVETISAEAYWAGGGAQLDLSEHIGEKYLFVTVSGSSTYSGKLNIKNFNAM